MTKAYAQVKGLAGTGVLVNLTRVVLDAPAGATELLVQTLSGGHGHAAAALAHRLIGDGIPVGNGNAMDIANPLRISFAGACLFKGRMQMLQAVLDAGPQPHMAHLLDTSAYLDYLCTTASEREQHENNRFALDGLVGLAARDWDICSYTRDALEMAMRISPGHPAWRAFAEDATGAGAFVRAYLMERKLAAAGAASATAGAGASSPTGVLPNAFRAQRRTARAV